MASKPTQFDILNKKLDHILDLLVQIQGSVEDIGGSDLEFDDPFDPEDYAERPLHAGTPRFPVKGYNNAPEFLVGPDGLESLVYEAVQVSQQMGLDFQLYDTPDGIRIMVDNAVSAEIHRRHTPQTGDA